ncbi:hypothetical protein [Rhodohalobacter sp.]|uniref:hypothetical protein n=1 Tax=Rhodohalobacter sp. TaxID=1974210 RepID=UPI002ACD25DF|nr:hypothetical protein [Rhodohalobacter sp.]MDZ7755142.1 hypothetical protein [Rhodohalobacter sp.]
MTVTALIQPVTLPTTAGTDEIAITLDWRWRLSGSPYTSNVITSDAENVSVGYTAYDRR